MSWTDDVNDMLQGLLDPDTGFGTPYVYTFSGGSTITLSGYFNAAYENVKLDGYGSAITTVHPVLGVRLADFAGTVGPAQDDTVVVNGVNYAIWDVQPDKQGDLVNKNGGALLLLKKQP
jgi:hypothetical protein